MTITALNFIAQRLAAAGVAYQFGQWTTNPVPDPYWVGEYTEIETPTRAESGQQVATFTLTGVGTSWLSLEQQKALIDKALDATAVLDNGNGIVIIYDNAFTVPTGNERLKRMQINFTINEWSVI